jgi:hypothetical protein
MQRVPTNRPMSGPRLVLIDNAEHGRYPRTNFDGSAPFEAREKGCRSTVPSQPSVRRLFTDAGKAPFTPEPKHVAIEAIVDACADARTWRGGEAVISCPTWRFGRLDASCQADPPAKLTPVSWAHSLYAQSAGDPPPPQPRPITKAGRPETAELAKEREKDRLRRQIMSGSAFHVSIETAEGHTTRTRCDITRFGEALVIHEKAMGGCVTVDRASPSSIAFSSQNVQAERRQQEAVVAGSGGTREAAFEDEGTFEETEDDCWLKRRNLEHEGAEGDGTWTRRRDSAGFDPTAPRHSNPEPNPTAVKTVPIDSAVVDGVWTSTTCPACEQTFPEPRVCSNHFWSCYDSVHEAAKSKNPAFANAAPLNTPAPTGYRCKQDGELGARVRLLHQTLLDAGQANLAECFLQLVAECAGDPHKVMAVAARTREHAKGLQRAKLHGALEGATRKTACTTAGQSIWPCLSTGTAQHHYTQNGRLGPRLLSMATRHQASRQLLT